ncbi:MAG: hypothetical protein QM778_19600 [Myxococcales bacterium]
MSRINPPYQSDLPVLGVDVGRVIIAPGEGPDDTSFLQGHEDQALETPPTEACFETLAALTDAFEGRVWIVSKAGPRIAARTCKWFAHHRFFELTGIEPSNVRFCRERRQKADHCIEHHITHFVDDRMDVLRHLLGLVPALYLFGAPHTARVHPGVQPVSTWRKAGRAILSAL